MLFQPGASFPGLPREGFDVFGIKSHEQRRLAILDVIHPSLKLLADDLLALLNPRATIRAGRSSM